MTLEMNAWKAKRWGGRSTRRWAAGPGCAGNSAASPRDGRDARPTFLNSLHIQAVAKLASRPFWEQEIAGSSPAGLIVTEAEVAEVPGCEPGGSGFESRPSPLWSRL